MNFNATIYVKAINPIKGKLLPLLIYFDNDYESQKCYTTLKQLSEISFLGMINRLLFSQVSDTVNVSLLFRLNYTPKELESFIFGY